MKGPNGFLPCRSCKIHSIRHIEGGGRTYYVPLHHADGSDYDPLNLLKRIYNKFIEQAIGVSTAQIDAEAE
jgi:hypothetical protein